MVTDILLVCLFFVILACSLTFAAVRYLSRQLEPLGRLDMMEHEETERGGPELCDKCDLTCFAQDWVCLCECHDGHVPLHKIAERKRVMEALGRLTGDK